MLFNLLLTFSILLFYFLDTLHIVILISPGVLTVIHFLVSLFLLGVIFLGFELHLVFSSDHVITWAPGSAKVYQSKQNSSIIHVHSDLCSHYQYLGKKSKCFKNVTFFFQIDIPLALFATTLHMFPLICLIFILFQILPHHIFLNKYKYLPSK